VPSILLAGKQAWPHYYMPHHHTMKSLDKLAGLLENQTEKYTKQGWFTTRQAAEKFQVSRSAIKAKLARLHKAGKIQKKVLNDIGGKVSIWLVP
jgi:predicted ArsR family transcriptional regulator